MNRVTGTPTRVYKWWGLVRMRSDYFVLRRTVGLTSFRAYRPIDMDSAAFLVVAGALCAGLVPFAFIIN